MRRSARSCASAPTSRRIRTRSTSVLACRCSTWSRWCTGFIARCGRRVFSKTDRERDRLDRRLRAQAANGFERCLHRLRRYLRRGEAAESSLTAAHAASGDGLETIDFAWTEVRTDRGAQLTRRDAFAPANHNAVGEIVNDIGRPGEGAGETALEAAKARDLPPRMRPVDAGDRGSEILEYRACGKLAGDRGSLRAADSRAIAGDVHVAATSAVRVGARQPLAKGVVVGKRGPGKLGKLCLRLEAKPDRDSVAWQRDFVSAAAAQADRFHAGSTLECAELNTMVHGNARPAELGHVSETACKHARRGRKLQCCRNLRAERRGIEHRDNLGAHRPVLRGGEIEQGRAAAEHDAPPDQATMLLEQDLSAAEREHARQCPAGDWQRAIGGTRRKDERVKLDRSGGIALDRMQRPILDAPRKRQRTIVDVLPEAVEDGVRAP